MPSLLGQRITWDVVRGERVGRTTITHVEKTRAGIVWSAGPLVGTAWVIPDQPEPGEGNAVCVHINGKGHTATPNDWVRSDSGAQEIVLAALRGRARLPEGFATSRKSVGFGWVQPMGYSLERGGARNVTVRAAS